jgi:hypothetical protein
VLWTRGYNSLNGGPDGVNVIGGTVYAATDKAAVALSTATGKQLWSRPLTGNDLEGIDMGRSPGQCMDQPGGVRSASWLSGGLHGS